MHSLLEIKVHIKRGLVLLSKTESVADKTPILLILWLDILISSLHLRMQGFPSAAIKLSEQKSLFLNFITVKVSSTECKTLGKLF